MTEFYLTTLWTYTPKAVEEVIRDMEAKKFVDLPFLFCRPYTNLQHRNEPNLSMTGTTVGSRSAVVRTR